MNELKLKGSLYWRASNKAFLISFLSCWNILLYMCTSEQGQNMQHRLGCCAQDPLYSVHFTGLLCSPEIPSSRHTLGNDSFRSNLGACGAAAVESSSVLWVVGEALLYLREEGGLITQCRRPHF